MTSTSDKFSSSKLKKKYIQKYSFINEFSFLLKKKKKNRFNSGVSAKKHQQKNTKKQKKTKQKTAKD